MCFTKGDSAFKNSVSFNRSINYITYNRSKGFINDTRRHEDSHASAVELKIELYKEVVLSRLSLNYI